MFLKELTLKLVIFFFNTIGEKILLIQLHELLDLLHSEFFHTILERNFCFELLGLYYINSAFTLLGFLSLICHWKSRDTMLASNGKSSNDFST